MKTLCFFLLAAYLTASGLCALGASGADKTHRNRPGTPASGSIINADNWSADNWWSQGVLDESQGKLSQAGLDYQHAVSLAPNDYIPHVTFANFLYRQNRLSEAVKEMRQIVRLRPNLAYWHLRLGNTLNLTGNQVQARKEWHQVILLDDDGGYGDEANKMLKLTGSHH